MSRVEIETSFRSSFEVSVVDRIDRLNADRVLSFPGCVELDVQRSVSNGVITEVAPYGEPAWTGVFEWGSGFSPMRDRVITWPDEASFCVIQRGYAVVVDAHEPEKWFEVECEPVRDVLALPRHRLVVFADFTDLLAYGAAGLVWRSGRLAWDDIRLEGVSGDEILVSGYDPPRGGNPVFTVNAHTGSATDPPWRRSR